MATITGKNAVITFAGGVIAATSVTIALATAIQRNERYRHKTPLERMADRIGELCCRDLRRIERKWKRSR